MVLACWVAADRMKMSDAKTPVRHNDGASSQSLTSHGDMTPWAFGVMAGHDSEMPDSKKRRATEKCRNGVGYRESPCSSGSYTDE